MATKMCIRDSGHYNAGFTLSTYVHSTPSMRVQAADTIGQMIGREVV